MATTLAGRLVFTLHQGGHDVIATVDPSGQHQTLVLPSGFYGGNVSWSPDGKLLLFDSDHAATTPPDGDGFHIDFDVVSASGGTPTALTQRGINGKGSWSADGAHIAFERQDKDGAPDHISVMNADGTGQRDITTNTFGKTDEDPSFSPDGTRIAFQRHRSDSDSALLVVTVASGDVTQLTDWASQTSTIQTGNSAHPMQADRLPAVAVLDPARTRVDEPQPERTKPGLINSVSVDDIARRSSLPSHLDRTPGAPNMAALRLPIRPRRASGRRNNGTTTV